MKGLPDDFNRNDAETKMSFTQQTKTSMSAMLTTGKHYVTQTLPSTCLTLVSFLVCLETNVYQPVSDSVHLTRPCLSAINDYLPGQVGSGHLSSGLAD